MSVFTLRGCSIGRGTLLEDIGTGVLRRATSVRGSAWGWASPRVVWGICCQRRRNAVAQTDIVFAAATPWRMPREPRFITHPRRLRSHGAIVSGGIGCAADTWRPRYLHAEWRPCLSGERRLCRDVRRAAACCQGCTIRRLPSKAVVPEAPSASGHRRRWLLRAHRELVSTLGAAGKGGDVPAAFGIASLRLLQGIAARRIPVFRICGAVAGPLALLVLLSLLLPVLRRASLLLPS
mmetsp:Transcript_44120/g.122166  ORF Transcript_44120/g.122166 Transcript_44120/m.122166 type:complete len:236 (-) Transcript_44120:1496-2203(-)